MCCISEASTLTTVVILIPFYLGVRLHYHLRQTDSPTPPPTHPTRITFQVHSHVHSHQTRTKF